MLYGSGMAEAVRAVRVVGHDDLGHLPRRPTELRHEPLVYGLGAARRALRDVLEPRGVVHAEVRALHRVPIQVRDRPACGVLAQAKPSTRTRSGTETIPRARLSFLRGSLWPMPLCFFCPLAVPARRATAG